VRHNWPVDLVRNAVRHLAIHSVALFLIFSACLTATAYGQGTDGAAATIPVAVVVPVSPVAATTEAQSYERPASWRSLFPNIGSDPKRIWLSPSKLNRRRFLIPTLAILGTAAVLVAADPHEAPWFLTTSQLDGFTRASSGSNTEYGTLAVPVSLYLMGAVLKDSKMRKTALPAGEAVGDFEILGTILKDTTQRTRPIAIGTGRDYSFPSGHTGAPSL
jgi:hypothetical protein